MSGLLAALRVTRGALRVELDLTVGPGEVLALLGPNGAGKSTALAVLAGLLRPDAGHVTLDDEVLDEPARGYHQEPNRRRVGVVFQDRLLFPHLSARDNVAFGPRARGAGRAAARATAERWLQRLGLAEYAGARPGDLSGGQAQRVALARALATEPRLLLLDEPLSALDAGTRAEARSTLRRHLPAYGGATVLVTHDPIDATVLADRVIVVEDGSAVQEGAPAAVARAPRTPYVASLLGLNLFRGEARRGVVALDGGGSLAVAHPVDGPVLVTVAPAAIALYRSRPDGSPRNAWSATVTQLERHGDAVRIRVTGPPDAFADVTPAAVADLDLTPGSRVWAVVKATETDAYPA